ncbi:hypothetical protein [Phocaeicola sp.]|uniref:hypothetical protein n=1 Tax=Phocaeicola sp. TaxID=2773926 RepID=UPI00386BC692
MKQILKDWDLIRIIRLILGTVLGGYALWISNYMLLLLGSIFILQAVLNWSCCSASGCGTSASRKAIYKDMVKPYEPGINR